MPKAATVLGSPSGLGQNHYDLGDDQYQTYYIVDGEDVYQRMGIDAFVRMSESNVTGGVPSIPGGFKPSLFDRAVDFFQDLFGIGGEPETKLRNIFPIILKGVFENQGATAEYAYLHNDKRGFGGLKVTGKSLDPQKVLQAVKEINLQIGAQASTHTIGDAERYNKTLEVLEEPPRDRERIIVSVQKPDPKNIGPYFVTSYQNPTGGNPYVNVRTGPDTTPLFKAVGATGFVTLGVRNSGLSAFFKVQDNDDGLGGRGYGLVGPLGDNVRVHLTQPLPERLIQEVNTGRLVAVPGKRPRASRPSDVPPLNGSGGDDSEDDDSEDDDSEDDDSEDDDSGSGTISAGLVLGAFLAGAVPAGYFLSQ